MRVTGVRFLMTAVPALCVWAVSTAPAFAEVGPYIGVESGLSIDLDVNPNSRTTFTASNSNTSSTTESLSRERFNDGMMNGLTFGYALPGHLRPELEVAYRRNNVQGADQALSALTAMGNLWYDFEARTSYFYLGGGIGDAHLKLSDGPFGGATNDVFAYQFGTGAGYFITPQISIGVDYRYLATSSRASFDYGPFAAVNSSGQSGTVRAHSDARFRSQSIMLGLRYNFGSVWDPLNPYRQERSVQVVPVDSGN